MSDPKRWLEEGAGASATVREILRAGLHVDPPDGAEQTIWAAVNMKIAPPPGGPPADPTAAHAAGNIGGSVGLPGLSKVIVSGILGGSLLAGGGYVMLSPSSEERPPAALRAELASVFEAPRAPPAIESAAPAPAAQGQDTPRIAPQKPPSAARSPDKLKKTPPDGAAVRPNPLQEENLMLGEARAALRNGDPEGAMRMLDDMVARSPDGVLSQEREALTIEALYRAGRREAARARAAAFLRASPNSPHGPRLRRLLGEK